MASKTHAYKFHRVGKTLQYVYTYTIINGFDLYLLYNNKQHHTKDKGHPMISLCRQKRQRYRSKTFATLVLDGVGYSAACP